MSALASTKLSSKPSGQNSHGKIMIIVLAIIAIIGIIAITFVVIDFLFATELQGIQPSTSGPKIISIYVGTIPYGVDSTYSNTLREAQAFWEKRENVVFTEVSSQQEADIIVKWVKEFGGTTAGHNVYGTFIEIGLGDSNCGEKWKPYKYEIISQIAIHELGHSLGYKDDYSNDKSVMYYRITTSYEIDIEENDVLHDGGKEFYPVCTKKDIATYSIEVTSSEPLDIDVFTLVNDEIFNVPACEANEVELFNKICKIPAGSIIVLENPTIFGFGSSVHYTIKVKEI